MYTYLQLYGIEGGINISLSERLFYCGCASCILKGVDRFNVKVYLGN